MIPSLYLQACLQFLLYPTFEAHPAIFPNNEFVAQDLIRTRAILWYDFQAPHNQINGVFDRSWSRILVFER